jgi:hypothetical protein
MADDIDQRASELKTLLGSGRILELQSDISRRGGDPKAVIPALFRKVAESEAALGGQYTDADDLRAVIKFKLEDVITETGRKDPRSLAQSQHL